MANISKNEIVGLIGELVSKHSNRIATEELNKFEKENPGELVTPEIRSLVQQRALSELMFRTCNFSCPEDADDRDTITGLFENWVLLEEETKLREMCLSALREQLEKAKIPGEKDLSFTEKFLRQVKENRNNPKLFIVDDSKKE